MTPRAAWQRWVGLVERREPVVGLALFRCAIGAILVWSLARIWVTGAAVALWFPPELGGMGSAQGDWRIAWLGGPSAAAVTGLGVLAAVCGLAITVGIGTRWAALFAGQCLLALFALVPESGGGHDSLLTNALWLLVFAPSDASGSLACRMRTGRWVDPTPFPAIVRLLAVVQLTVAYTVTGWQKLGPEWWPWGRYEAVYRSLLQPDWARYDLAWIARGFPVTQAMTAATMSFEAGFPLVVLWMAARHRWPRLRRLDVRLVFLAVGLAMHGTLELAMNLGPFAWITTAYYLCFFDAEEYRQAVSILTRRGRPGRSEPAR